MTSPTTSPTAGLMTSRVAPVRRLAAAVVVVACLLPRAAADFDRPSSPSCSSSPSPDRLTPLRERPQRERPLWNARFQDEATTQFAAVSVYPTGTQWVVTLTLDSVRVVGPPVPGYKSESGSG